LKESWGIFAQNGNVRNRPTQPVIKALTEEWDELLADGEKRISVGQRLRTLCSPPYGANLASAGLFLGVFVAPRIGKLSILQSGQLSAVSLWAHDDVFRGKFLDIAGLHDVALVPVGEESSEWEVLLDEWEQSDSHTARVACLDRAHSLKLRVPVPPALAYREVHLREKSNESKIALEKMDVDQSAAISKIETGIQRNDVSLLSWGAAQLSSLAIRMANEKPLWTDYQVEEVQPHLKKEVGC
jgi:hypothetical protein